MFIIVFPIETFIENEVMKSCRGISYLKVSFV